MGYLQVIAMSIVWSDITCACFKSKGESFISFKRFLARSTPAEFRRSLTISKACDQDFPG